MLRWTGAVAGAAALVTVFGGTAPAVEPVDTALRTAERAVGRDLPDVRPDAIGVPVRPEPIDVPAPEVARQVVRDAASTTVRSAVVGYIRIARTGDSKLLPAAWTTNHVVFGALADPNQWSCSGGGGTTSYTVTCTPVTLPVNVRYTCDVLHADIAATTLGASGKTSMDCNSDGTPEAQTGQKFGPGGYDFVWAVSNIDVTAFTCTLDLAVPTVTAGCGDPGTVGVE